MASSQHTGTPPQDTNLTDSPSPKPAGCSLHALIDPNLPPSQFMTPAKSLQQPSSTSCLAQTAMAVREAAKQIASWEKWPVPLTAPSTHTGRARVKWENPRSVIVITKPHDNRLIEFTRELAAWLITTPRPKDQGCALTVYVDSKLEKVKQFKYHTFAQSSPLIRDNLKFWTPKLCYESPDLFDFVVTLGGDGTVLFTSWLFQNVVPPVIPFHLGSLGFLTTFDFSDYKYHISKALEEGILINLRMRFTCTVYRYKRSDSCVRRIVTRQDPRSGEGWTMDLGTKRAEALENKGDTETKWMRNEMRYEIKTDMKEAKKQAKALEKQIMCFTTVPTETFEVLNDVVVDRGPSPYMSMLELFADDQHLTTIQADGLAVASPTGSTAYSLSAGGPLTHPEISTFLITPICPHTLSFRPMLLPDSMELRICVPFNSRATAYASFDGRGRIELKQGDHIKVTASKYPLPTVCKTSPSTDWFNSVIRCLKWNEREQQKSFAVVESEPNNDTPKKHQSRKHDPSKENAVSERNGDTDAKASGVEATAVLADDERNGVTATRAKSQQGPSSEQKERIFAYVSSRSDAKNEAEFDVNGLSDRDEPEEEEDDDGEDDEGLEGWNDAEMCAGKNREEE